MGANRARLCRVSAMHDNCTTDAREVICNELARPNAAKGAGTSRCDLEGREGAEGERRQTPEQDHSFSLARPRITLLLVDPLERWILNWWPIRLQKGRIAIYVVRQIRDAVRTPSETQAG